MIDFNSLTLDDFVSGILQGDPVILSRAITVLESQTENHQILAGQILEKILPHSGNSLRIGITGVPGVGKSTFIESFGQLLLKENKKIAVLAVDPSSKKHKGSILGDKTRMEKLGSDERVFIRPSPAGEFAGGIASKTRETILLLESAGFNTILVETVGVGQSETAVYNMVDIFVLLLLAGAGDELQGIKRGIMEMADIIAITKCDGDNIDRSKSARLEFKRAVHLFPLSASGWATPVETCSGLTGMGLDSIFEKIKSYETFTKQNNYFNQKRKEQLLDWFHDYLQDTMMRRFIKNSSSKNRLQSYEQAVVNGHLTAVAAVEALVNEMNRSDKKFKDD